MSIDTDYAVLREVLPQAHVGFWAVEFGVYSGYSLGIIAEHMPVIGFDSFEGLPEDWREGFPKGMFQTMNSASINEWIVPANTMMVKGWFKDTAVGFPFPPLSLIHIDCDLYSSTVTALSAIRYDILPGAIIVFDEFQGYEGSKDHEEKAWMEFVLDSKIMWDRIAEGEQEVAFRIESVGGM